ncbi:serine peptidase [Streptomyces mirabilis]|uniref:serine peptidase n=1 Tax=Streptomyces mirabilis TaxID=68239 RepID=UPI0036D19AC7
MNIVVVHGIFNRRAGRSSEEAAEELASVWQQELEVGLASAGLLNTETLSLRVAYYADKLVKAETQGDPEVLEDLTAEEQAIVTAWLMELGAPTPHEPQGLATMPVRQMLDWVSRRRRVNPSVLFRIAVALAREAHRYLHDPTSRVAARTAVAETVRTQRPTILIAHSLGSVVAYEALHDHDDLKVDCFVTLGSPLGLPGAVFDHLDPQPSNRLGARPAGIGRWINIADVGDLVAVPRRLGDRFPVDKHAEIKISPLDFHTMGSYLSSGQTFGVLKSFIQGR